MPKIVARILRIVLAVVVAIALFVGFAWWTMVRMPGSSIDGPLPPLTESERTLIPQIRSDVEHLSLEIGPRNLIRYRENLEQARDFVASRFQDLGYSVTNESYFIQADKATNLVTHVQGSDLADEIVLVGAHYDTWVDTPGANDNASGIAALLALAERLAGTSPKRTIRFVAFANEEPPFFDTEYQGAFVHAKRSHGNGDKIVAMLSLESLGYYSDDTGSQKYPAPFDRFYPSTGNFVGVVGNFGSRELVRRVVGSVREHGSIPCEGGGLPRIVTGVDWSDHWPFWEYDIPAVMITDTAPFRYWHYHQPTDLPSELDFERMARVVDALAQTVTELADKSS